MTIFLTRFMVFYRRAAVLLLLVGLLGLAGLATKNFLFATSTYGIGVRTDSVAYLWGAENLAKGLGLGRLNGLGELKPMTHWPPFYPLVLSLFELAGMPALAGARYLGAVLVGLMIFLAGLTAWRMTRSAWFSLSAAALLWLAPSLWITSLDAMTEPLYVVLGLAGALLLDGYLTARLTPGRRRAAFVLSALCMALALLTRYAGASLIGAAGLLLLFDGSRDWRARLKQALAYGVLCAVPMLLWMLRNQLEAGSATNRVLEIIPIAASDWTLLWQTMSAWVAPLPSAFGIGPGKLLLASAAAGLFVALSLAERAAQAEPASQAGLARTEGSEIRPASRLPLFYAIYAVAYPAFVIFSRLVFDRLITVFEERIAFPWFLTLLLLLVFGAAALLRLTRFGRKVAPAGRQPFSQSGLALVVGAGLVALYVILAYSFGVLYRDEQGRVLDDTWHSGRGLNTEQALNSEFAIHARAVDSQRVIYTDNIEILYFVSGQHAFQANEANAAALADMREKLAGHRLAFIFLYDTTVPQMVQREFPQARVVYHEGNSIILEVDSP
jgi:hypothetical protein